MIASIIPVAAVAWQGISPARAAASTHTLRSRGTPPARRLLVAQAVPLIPETWRLPDSSSGALRSAVPRAQDFGTPGRARQDRRHLRQPGRPISGAPDPLGLHQNNWQRGLGSNAFPHPAE